MSFQSIAAVAYLAWPATLLGYGLWTQLLARYPANKVAPFTMLVPLIGVATGWLAFDEALKSVQLVGGGLLLAGLFVNLFGAPLFERWKRKT